MKSPSESIASVVMDKHEISMMVRLSIFDQVARKDVYYFVRISDAKYIIRNNSVGARAVNRIFIAATSARASYLLSHTCKFKVASKCSMVGRARLPLKLNIFLISLKSSKPRSPPSFFSVTGRMGPEALCTRLLRDKIAHKQEYSCVTNFFKCKLSFLIYKLIMYSGIEDN